MFICNNYINGKFEDSDGRPDLQEVIAAKFGHIYFGSTSSGPVMGGEKCANI